ncbi:MAG: membrane protein insertion efficiency factor YidD [Actinomyces sp.]|nr:membrane protein insertion efficiency factor YidD [Actinomyces sp.]
MSARRSPLAWLFLQPIRLYQRLLSPLMPPSCRYAPTCSAYAVEALQVHGALKGMVLATWRLLRCNPWSLGGVDHVPPRGRWRPDPWIPPEDWAGHADVVEPAPMGLERDLRLARDLSTVTPARPRTSSPSDEGGAALVDTDLPAAAGRPVGAQCVPTI